MKTEFERISEIMYTLLEHKPVIDVPYEKINDIAVALVKEGYGKVSEYKAEIERLKAENEHKKKQYDNQLAENTRLHIEYDKAFERLKAQQREIDKLKADNEQLEEDIDMLIKEQKYDHEGEIVQAKIDVLNELKVRHDYANMAMGHPWWDISQQIDEFIEEVQNGEDKS